MADPPPDSGDGLVASLLEHSRCFVVDDGTNDCLSKTDLAGCFGNLPSYRI